VSSEDIPRGHHPFPHRRLVRHLLGGSLVGVLGIVPATATAWAWDGEPPPAQQIGTDTRHYGLPLQDDGPWEPEPVEAYEEQPEDLAASGIEEVSAEGPDAGAAEGTEPQFEGGPRERSPDSWSSPVRTADVSAPYGIPGEWIAGHHTGIDFAVPVGTPVRAVGSGTVHRVGSGGDYGEMVIVQMDDGRYALFAHLSETFVSKGERVTTGDLLGYSGDTGRSSGPHLHFEVRETPEYGSDIDPVSYLADKGVSL
jgi:murein DD-endopeptidase MepM/ murein hydrolase activator NlpD